MQLTLVNAACVLVGSLNRAILQPPWLVDNHLIEPGPDGPPPMDIIMRVGPNLHRIETEEFVWVIEPGKLQIQAKDPNADADPGAKVASLLGILEHTPVLGVGNNFSFKADGVELLDAKPPPVVAALQKVLGGGELTTLTFHARRQDPHVQVTVERHPQMVLFHFNFHRDTGIATQAKSIAERWKEDRDDALKLVDQMRKDLS